MRPCIGTSRVSRNYEGCREPEIEFPIRLLKGATCYAISSPIRVYWVLVPVIRFEPCLQLDHWIQRLKRATISLRNM